jgi:hypothetical protein
MCSGVIAAVLKNAACCRDGTCIDFAFAERAGFEALGDSVPTLRFVDNVGRRVPLLKDAVRPIPPCAPSLGSLGASWRTSRTSKLLGSMPGPIDFRGPRVVGFGGAWGGKWL